MEDMSYKRAHQLPVSTSAEPSREREWILKFAAWIGAIEPELGYLAVA